MFTSFVSMSYLCILPATLCAPLGQGRARPHVEALGDTPSPGLSRHYVSRLVSRPNIKPTCAVMLCTYRLSNKLCTSKTTSTPPTPNANPKPDSGPACHSLLVPRLLAWRAIADKATP